MQHLAKGLDEADVIVTTGGVSMGEKVRVVGRGIGRGVMERVLWEGFVLGGVLWGGVCIKREWQYGAGKVA